MDVDLHNVTVYGCLQGGKASPMVCYNVLNVLYAYAYAVRLYNGEHLHLAVEASQVQPHVYTRSVDIAR